MGPNLFETLNDPGTGTRGRSDRYGLFVRGGDATPVCIGPAWRSRCCHDLDAQRPLGPRLFVVIGFCDSNIVLPGIGLPISNKTEAEGIAQNHAGLRDRPSRRR